MAKTLELQFLTENGKTARISIDNPKEPIEEAVVKASMEAIVASGAFFTANGNLASAQGVRVIERNVTDYEII
ncbi:DUF2922 domain-containing protein [Neobacillus sp. K501]